VIQTGQDIAGGAWDPSVDTRQRVLEAAGQVFAEQGFRAATVREICARAGANIAAVNYHFRDKEGLYREVMNFAAGMALEVHASMPTLLRDGSIRPEERLRGFVRGHLRRVLDDKVPAWHSRLVMRELADPTPELAMLCDRFFRPVHAALGVVVRELLGPAATDARVRMTVCSIIGQCVFYKHCREAALLLMPEQGYGAADIDGLADHIAEFSLGAIASMRAGAERTDA
jgi:AcrR family transcriptional regulator